ncbi:MAG TPA: nucleotide exchange factor GrpE [Bacteroidales bacterium]|nr:nucleotide exchange factor GrpE [Bacteroidales bacterium]
MMMKKKQKPQEEAKININTESAENKDNTPSQKDQDINKTGVPASEQQQQQSEEEKADNAPETDKVENELKETMSKLAEMQDKYIRLSAEFDNYRKRTLREKMDISKYAEENLLIKIIPLMDDFERALKHMEDASDCVAMKSGIDLIYGKFNEFLRQNGVKEIEALNSNFNVDIHEAVAKVPVPEEDQKGKVVDVILKGYYLQDKVLRFSKVVVGE